MLGYSLALLGPGHAVPSIPHPSPHRDVLLLTYYIYSPLASNSQDDGALVLRYDDNVKWGVYLHLGKAYGPYQFEIGVGKLASRPYMI